MILATNTVGGNVRSSTKPRYLLVAKERGGIFQTANADNTISIKAIPLISAFTVKHLQAP